LSTRGCFHPETHHLVVASYYITGKLNL
jgi:hypothetical protein